MAFVNGFQHQVLTLANKNLFNDKLLSENSKELERLQTIVSEKVAHLEPGSGFNPFSTRTRNSSHKTCTLSNKLHH